MLPISNDPKKETLKDILLGLHWAATTGNVGLVKFALDHGVPIDSIVNGFVPLQLACISDNNIAAVQYLIDRGADVNIQKWSKKYSVDKNEAVQGATGSTALHVACVNGCVKIVDLLIRNNSRVDVKDKYGSTPLDVAQAKHETEIVNLLKDARVKQQKKNSHYHHHHYHSKHHDEHQHESHTRKSIDSMMTHKRTISDKQSNRIRRPSLPSIFEGCQHTAIPSFISMTQSSSNNNLELPASRRSFSSTAAHRPSVEEIHTHSCPVTPSSSLDQHSKRSHASSLSIPISSSSPRSSEESSSHMILSSSPSTSLYTPAGNADWSTAVTADGRPDWYAYGVVNPYDDENYLLSLERRAYNLGCYENGSLERHSQEMTRRSHDHYSYYRRNSNADDASASSSSTNHQQQDNRPTKHRSSSDDSGHLRPLRTTALKNAMAAHSTVSTLSANESTTPSDNEYDNEYDEDEEEVYNEEEQYQSEPLPRPSVVLDDDPEEDSIRYRFQQQEEHRPHSTDQPEVKKGWFSGFGKEVGRHSLDSIQRKSLDLRPNFDHLTQHFVAKRNNQDGESSDEDIESSKHNQRNGFFSRWAPAWSKRQ